MDVKPIYFDAGRTDFQQRKRPFNVKFGKVGKKSRFKSIDLQKKKEFSPLWMKMLQASTLKLFCEYKNLEYKL